MRNATQRDNGRRAADAPLKTREDYRRADNQSLKTNGNPDSDAHSAPAPNAPLETNDNSNAVNEARRRSTDNDLSVDEPRIGLDGKQRHPLAVTDPKIRELLQFAGLRFMCSRARWLESEALLLGTALKSGAMTSDEVDAKLEEMGAIDLVYPELMGYGE